MVCSLPVVWAHARYAAIFNDSCGGKALSRVVHLVHFLNDERGEGVELYGVVEVGPSVYYAPCSSQQSAQGHETAVLAVANGRERWASRDLKTVGSLCPPRLLTNTMDILTAFKWVNVF